MTASGIPIYPFKLFIPIAGAFLLLQGIAEIIRALITLRVGKWPERLHDVEGESIEELKEILGAADTAGGRA